MSIYNEKTINANIEVKLIERNDGSDSSEWEVKTAESIEFLNGGILRILPAGATFKYEGEYDDEEGDVIEYVKSKGILSACDVSDGGFERDYLEGEE